MPMTEADVKREVKQASIADWLRIYQSLTDPDAIDEQKRLLEKKKRAEEKKKDTGL